MATIAYPVTPTVTPLRGTLLDAATVSDSTFAWNEGIDLFDSYNCLRFDAEADFCAPASKDFDGAPGWQDGVRFAAYGGVLCKTIGLDRARMEAEVRRAFEAGESTAVERAMMKYRFVANPDGSGLPGDWTAPTDITPAGGAVKASLAVGMLEDYAGQFYVGAPTLHMPRSVASMILGVDGAEFSGDVLNTKLGSKIAAGAGYSNPNTGPTGAAAAAGEAWVYATGEVVISRSEPIIRQAIDHAENDVYVLAERAYVAAIDCFAAAIRVNLSA